MWRKNTDIAEGGCPIGEQESDENPIYPYVDNMKYNMICYLKSGGNRDYVNWICF